MKYGDRLKRLRNKKGLSQKELTKRLNLNRSTYARYETSTTQPDFDTLKKLANFHKVSVDYILGNSDDPYEAEDPEFEEFIQNVRRWYKEAPKDKEEDLARLRRIFEANKND